jgi:hypothetical protein
VEEEDEQEARTSISVYKLANSKIGFNSYERHFNTYDTYLISRFLTFYFEKSVECTDYQLTQFLNVWLVPTHRICHLNQNLNNKHTVRYCNKVRRCSHHVTGSPCSPRGTKVCVTLVTELIGRGHTKETGNRNATAISEKNRRFQACN